MVDVRAFAVECEGFFAVGCLLLLDHRLVVYAVS